MPDLITIAVVALAGAGIAEGINAATTSKPKAPGQPEAPSGATASTAAAATVSDQRAAMLASGGQVDYTGGLGVLTGSDVSKSTLTGG